ncbi:MAG: ArnT family glycosyltransferase [Dissulfurimicrobium sp.]|uniref:ArnT family glycosyltransferase n=1 Tax=Dissulfurimicrobium sp. TaxID=2022436 RepID=UPI004049C910
MDSSRLACMQKSSISVAAIAFVFYIWATPFRDLYGLEARTALMAREMLEGGLSFFPTAFGNIYPDYTPLYFWLEAVFSMPVRHVSTFSAVLPSALSAAGLVAITYRLGAEISPRTGFFSAVILVTNPQFWHEASHATIDMLLAFFTGFSILCLFLADNEGRRRYYLLFIPSIFLGFLTKGPIGLVLPGVIWCGYLILSRRYREFLSFSILMVLMGAVLMGFEFFYAWHRGGMTLMQKILVAQVIGRVGEEANQPAYYYVAFLAQGIGLWWIWVAAWGIRVFRSEGPGADSIFRAMAGDKVLRLLLAWFFLVLLLFSLASSRHGRYLMPLFPALSIFLGMTVQNVVKMTILGHNWLYIRFFDMILAVLLLVGFSVAIFKPPFSLVTPAFMVLIWVAVVVAGRFLIARLADLDAVLPSMAALLLACGLSGYGLIFEPALSIDESGRDFITEAERGMKMPERIVLYGMKQDGDGVKYALYSKAPSKDILFIPRLTAGLEGLKNNMLPQRFILVGYKKDVFELKEHSQAAFIFIPAAQGLIHRKEVMAMAVRSL